MSDLGKASDLGKVNDLGKASDFGKVSDLEKATYLSLSATVILGSESSGECLQRFSELCENLSLVTSNFEG